jgi:hypothetical protein
MSQSDPIFAAIERYECADAECLRIPDEDEARLASAFEESRRARCALAETAPTTLDGLAALARFLDQQSSTVLETAFFDNDREHLAFYANLNLSLMRIEHGQRRSIDRRRDRRNHR